MNYLLILALSSLLAVQTWAQDLPYSTPSREGVSKKALVELIQKGAETNSDVVIVVKNGKVIVEKYYARGKRRTSIQSVTKSFTSLLIGGLLKEGKLKSLDENITQWYPELKSDPWKSRITVRMLLNHTSGFVDNPASWASPDFVKFYLMQRLQFQPATSYQYTTGGVALLGPIIEATAGMNARALIQQTIFDPMNITDWSWVSYSGGNVATGGGLYMQAIDLAKIGQMLLQKGQWHGKSIVSSEWLEESLKPSQKYFTSYGLLWWKLKGDAYTAQGYGGQYMTIYPSQNLVAVRLRMLDPNDSKAAFKKKSYYDFPHMIEKLSQSVQ